MKCLSEIRCFNGRQLRYSHFSESCQCDMVFSVFLPPQAANRPVPVVYWLSGLTCTDENFVTKAGAQRYAAELGVAVVAPDTSPRGEGVADDPDQAWDFGLGAGFYVNATQSPWDKHYHMYDYVTRELPELVEKNFPVTDAKSICGHSMGGHGAITIALKNPQSYASVSAFAPICAPIQCAWGQKALGLYLGEDQQAWQAYDSCALIQQQPSKLPLLVDQGSADSFLAEQLKPELLQQACISSGQPLTYRLQDGFDHSYFFIASFIGEHLAFHAGHLNQR